MIRRLHLPLLLATAAVLVGCVPPAGDYSEFATRGKARQALATPGPDNTVTFAEGRYQGSLRNGRPDGTGSFRFNSGRRYEGGFAEGRAHGQGRMHYPDGRVVAGEYERGRERAVEIRYADGRRFAGEVADGRAAGAGVMTLASGEQLTARFRNDQAEGNGQLAKADGTPVYTGPFRQGRPDGEGICGAGAAAAACIQKNGQDITEDVQQRQARIDAERQINEEAARERAELDRELRPQREERERELASAESAARAWRGPESSDGCYCAFNFCLTVESIDTTPEQRELDEIASARHDTMCRAKYADYLGNKGRSDYQATLRQLDEKAAEVRLRHARLRAEEKGRQDAIEARRQQWLRDEEAKKELVRQAAARREQERQEELRKQKEDCANGGLKRSPCRCRAILGLPREPTPPGKFAACEA
jgi:hypothetical protein